MKSFKYYEMKDGTEPLHPEYISKPRLPKYANAAEARSYADELEAYDSKMAEYDRLLNIYRTEEAKRRDEFTKDLLDEFGVRDNPKAEKCFSMAWQNGRSRGYREVYGEFQALVELIK